MPLFSRADVELYYECHGRGAPLLLVAGLASDSASWQPVLAEFASRYRVVTATRCSVRRDRKFGALDPYGEYADVHGLRAEIPF